MIQYAGWFLSLAAPVALLYAIRAVPYPGSLLLTGVVIGVFAGYLIYEHAAAHEEIPDKTLVEQILLGIFILLTVATVL